MCSRLRVFRIAREDRPPRGGRRHPARDRRGPDGRSRPRSASALVATPDAVMELEITAPAESGKPVALDDRLGPPQTQADVVPPAQGGHGADQLVLVTAPRVQEHQQRIGVVRLVLPRNEPRFHQVAGLRELVEDGGAFSRSLVILGNLPCRRFGGVVHVRTVVASIRPRCLLVVPSGASPASQSIATILPPFNKPPSYFQFCLKFRRMRSESPPICRNMLGLCGLSRDPKNGS